MTENTDSRQTNSPLALFSGALPGTLLRYGGLALIDAFAIWLVLRLLDAGNWPIAAVIALITVGLNVIFLNERLFPYRWLSPGLALMVLMVLYPVIITVYYAFTNFRTGNLLTQTQAIELIQARPEYRYLPEGEQLQTFTAYRNPDTDEYVLWLEGRDDSSLTVAYETGAIEPVTPELAGVDGVTIEETEDGPPTATIEGFEPLTTEAAADALAGAESLEYGHPINTLPLTTITEDTEAESGYLLDPAQGIVVDYNGRSPVTYNAQVFAGPDGQYALWLTEEDGDSTVLARPGKPVVLDGQPQSIGDYRILSNRERTAFANDLRLRSFGDPENPIQVDPFSANRAGRFRSLFEYDAETNRMVHRDTGVAYEPVDGTFTLIPETVPEDLDEQPEPFLTPGYFVVVGFDNFVRLFTNSGIWGPFLTIFVWTIIHAGATVIITFALGMAIALLMDDEIIPKRKLFRSLILIPYTIPAFISVVVWRGMFDPNLGFINDVLGSIFGTAPQWYGNATAARFAILMIQLWLGFPYMMLIVTGALQGIPKDMYEAADVDGASPWQKFRTLTLPLILVAVGPLLIASFAFNFNNFTVIELFNNGGPAIAGSTVPSGHTDILITYTYRQAFGTQGGTDYAFASTISLFIFLIVAAITIINFRFTGQWEEVSENV
ncbi:MAG: hypothetical protein CL610_28650 [Anaerolineaceae bacterium]|nr:hypothetical protein [Anaerolineaceae bacterium]